ncbi:hypothetical protein, partial [Pseudomonas carnis]|uniref:hypothetical protein n=1 Tax=Pseudomonas carnis TaxID=2487355 RepID=UPI001E5F257F
LACDSGGSADSHVADTPLSQASQLPHFLPAFHPTNRHLFDVKKYQDTSLTISSLDTRRFFS